MVPFNVHDFDVPAIHAKRRPYKFLNNFLDFFGELKGRKFRYFPGFHMTGSAVETRLDFAAGCPSHT